MRKIKFTVNRIAGPVKDRLRQESGVSLLEVLVALALLGIVAVAFLSGSGTATRSAMVADEQATAESLARSQMEYIKSLEYSAEYTPAAVPDGGDYAGYTASIEVDAPLDTDGQPATDVNVQKITVIISRNSEQILALEGYKANR